jgi:hypothetical protein
MTICNIINPTTAALLGACIGGVIGIIGTLITTWASFSKDTKAFKRSKSQKYIDEVLSAYSFALNVFFNVKRGGAPDRATYGDVYARLSLFGSAEVKRILNEIIKLSPDKNPDLDIDRLIIAMQAHVGQLETEAP